MNKKKTSTWKTIFAGAGFLAGFILVPLFGGVFIIGAAAGFISDGYRLHADNTLRATGTAVTATIDDIDVRRFTENWGRVRTECVPIAVAPVDGKQHTWDLVRYDGCGDYFTTDQTVQLRYDPDDVDRVVLADDAAPDVNHHNLGVDVQILVIGVAMSAVGVGCWLWLARDNKRRAKQP